MLKGTQKYFILFLYLYVCLCMHMHTCLLQANFSTIVTFGKRERGGIKEEELSI